MADEPKPKMMSEDEHKKRLAQELEAARDKTIRYSIKNGVSVSPQSLSPRIEITLEGGEAKAVCKLAIAIERLILDFVEPQLQ